MLSRLLNFTGGSVQFYLLRLILVVVVVVVVVVVGRVRCWVKSVVTTPRASPLSILSSLQSPHSGADMTLTSQASDKLSYSPIFLYQYVTVLLAAC